MTSEPTVTDWHNVMCAISQWIEIKKEADEYGETFNSLERTSEWIWNNKIISTWKDN